MKTGFLRLAALFSMGASILAAESAAGLYEGFWTTPDGKKGRVTAQVRPIAGGKFDGFVALYRARSFEGALKLKPAAGEVLKFEAVAAKSADGSLTAPLEGSFELAAGKLTGRFKGDLGEGAIEASKTNPESPTLGAKPPPMAVVLFDGKNANGWSDFRWKITPEGSMVVQNGDIHAREKYANYNLHIEFKTPLMPDAEGQGRGNSGVYLQNKYEVQVLDSFGLFPLQNNDCGGIYTVKAPEVNACFPPGVWQTYDITFVQGNPALKHLPTVTVVHNGVTIIEKIEIPAHLIEKGTGGGEAGGGFLKLQDHGNPVEYRNIWVEPFFALERK